MTTAQLIAVAVGVAAPVAAVVAALISGRSAKKMATAQLDAARKGDRDALKRAAYGRLLAASGLMVHTAQVLRQTVELRSGIKEGIDVTMGIRKPTEPLDIYNLVRQDLDPLYQAWADVWTTGSADAIRRSNQVVGLVAEIMGTATTRGAARSPLVRLLAGDKWTKDQLEELARQIRVLAESRRQFGLLARDEFGYESADLFASMLEHEVQDPE